ncbi:hypothetical protein [Hymenobacter jeollabukensis]|uniref:Lipoprotein n=1 Tax=Hymenobacter jeollabukensis TaxID=2025313 RepID=A0A5R8WJC1_9BACT|nr:hypothetical protein [Hymenobacter jeollabukensis]TLM88703.1 hypothetical protein FDY95_22985 [Hymenobacter jeollabukensis]
MSLIRSFSSTALLSLLALGACKKKEVYPELRLPEATQSGANTAGAKVDGQVWVPETSLFVGAPLSATYQREGSRRTLRLYFSRVPASESAPLNETSFRFQVADVRSTGRIDLNQVAQPTFPSLTAPYATFKYAKPFPGREFITGPDATGHLTITRLDTVARIVAGTFEFQARETGGTGTVTVTDGRFDMKF